QQAADLLRITDLHTYFHMGKNHIAKAVDGVSFSIRENETLAIVGESGSGKSVTALSIMRLISSPPGEIVQGTIELNGTNLLDLSKREMNQVRKEEVGMIFQDPMTSLNPVFTIGNQMADTLIKRQKYSTKEAYNRANEFVVLEGRPSTEQKIMQSQHQLCGATRQRVMIARAMSTQHKLLIVDIPTLAFQVTKRAKILLLMFQMQEE